MTHFYLGQMKRFQHDILAQICFKYENIEITALACQSGPTVGVGVSVCVMPQSPKTVPTPLSSEPIIMTCAPT